MTDEARELGFVPPPHINAEPHKRMMDKLNSMTVQERADFLFKISVEAGIYTPDGELTAAYRDDVEDEDEPK